MTLPRLFVLGDSISMHYGPHLQPMLAGRFEYARKTESQAGDDPNDYGANGGDSNECLRFLGSLRDGAGLDADVLLLNCGLHDLKVPAGREGNYTALDAYRENLHRLVALVRSLGPALLWVRTTPVDETMHNRPNSLHRYAADVEAYNAVADDVMKAHADAVFDLNGFTCSLGPLTETLSDGRHYHEPIRRLQAAYLAGCIETWWNGRKTLDQDKHR